VTDGSSGLLGTMRTYYQAQGSDFVLEAIEPINAKTSKTGTSKQTSASTRNCGIVSLDPKPLVWVDEYIRSVKKRSRSSVTGEGETSSVPIPPNRPGSKIDSRSSKSATPGTASASTKPVSKSKKRKLNASRTSMKEKDPNTTSTPIPDGKRNGNGNESLNVEWLEPLSDTDEASTLPAHVKDDDFPPVDARHIVETPTLPTHVDADEVLTVAANPTVAANDDLPGPPKDKPSNGPPITPLDISFPHEAIINDLAAPMTSEATSTAIPPIPLVSPQPAHAIQETQSAPSPATAPSPQMPTYLAEYQAHLDTTHTTNLSFIHQATQQITSLQTELASAQAQSTALQKRKDDYRLLVHTMQTQAKVNDQLKARIENHETASTELKEELGKCQAEVGKHVKARALVDDTLIKQTKEINRLKKVIIGLKTEALLQVERVRHMEEEDKRLKAELEGLKAPERDVKGVYEQEYMGKYQRELKRIEEALGVERAGHANALAQKDVEISRLGGELDRTRSY
jgi:hypothetical protein